MEDTFRDGENCVCGRKRDEVLILISVEDTFREVGQSMLIPTKKVLILISVEDTFRGCAQMAIWANAESLNPYFSGRYVQSNGVDWIEFTYNRLNPYFSGRYVQSHDGIRGQYICGWSLNPYFSGRYVQSNCVIALKSMFTKVLILISVEDTFREKKSALSR